MTLRRLSTGLWGVTNFGAFNPFLNWWKIAASPTITRTVGGSLSGKAIWTAGGYLDTSTGEIVSPAPSDLLTISRNFFSPHIATSLVPNAKMDGETWSAEWDGSATAAIAAAGTGSSQTAVGGNKLNFTFGTSPGNVTLTLTLTNLNDPPRNIRIYQTRYATNVANGEKFNPDWLVQVSKFGELRFMDWLSTNNSTLTDFSQFADEAYMSWCKGFYDGVSNPIAASDHGPKGMLHPSLICQLANLADCDIHVTVPYLATDACVTSLATYYKNNTTKRVTFEYGNEHWNTGFYFFFWCFRQAAKIWGVQVQSMTAGNPTTITFAGAHGLSNGGNSDFYTDASGWTSLDASNQIVTVVNSTTITIPANTTGFPAFSSTDTWISQDFSRGSKWYGKRASEVMKIVKDVYADPARWRGAIGSQTASSSVSSNALTGINYWRANVLSPANSLAVSDLFSAIYVTGYFGDTQNSKQITGITKANPGVVTSADHGYSNGQRIKINIGAGMVELDETFATVANATTNTYELSGVNTTAMTTFASNSQNWTAKAAIFDLMDQSNTNFLGDPVNYPTKYTYFNQQMATSFRTGTCPAGFATDTNLTTLRATTWPAHRTIAVANGLELRQYEGGCHYVGDGLISGAGIGAQFTEYMMNMGYSAEIAAVYGDSYKYFIQTGGIRPSKFVEAAGGSQFGTWGGIRYFASAGNSNTDDTGNPVWVEVLDWNDNAQPETWAVRFGA